MHFPSIPRCFGIIFFPYKMTLRKASDVTHFVEEIPQGIVMGILFNNSLLHVTHHVCI